MKTMNMSLSLQNSSPPPKLKVLFLGYDKSKTVIFDYLNNNECEVSHTDSIITSIKGYDLVISFGYKHIITKDVLDTHHAPIINLHISYLPWNRGAHPNFWSHFDGTPSGVSIHLIDEGVDTGPILFQKYVNFTKNEDTFSKAYYRLIREVEILFIENLELILSKKYTITPQLYLGSCHRVADLPKEFLGWDSNITSEVRRLQIFLKSK